MRLVDIRSFVSVRESLKKGEGWILTSFYHLHYTLLNNHIWNVTCYINRYLHGIWLTELLGSVLEVLLLLLPFPPYCSFDKFTDYDGIQMITP
jgi:hypothetical protein